MKPVEFKEQSVVLAKDQPEYLPLPVHVLPGDKSMRMTSCWKADWKDRLRILFTGKVWVGQLTFGGRLQPQIVDSKKPNYVQ